eukprot:20559_1
MFLAVGLLFAAHFIACTFSQTCDVPYSCVGQQLAPNQDFVINGYKAAIGPRTSISFSGNPSQLDCMGACSCQSMSSITDCDSTWSEKCYFIAKICQLLLWFIINIFIKQSMYDAC